MVVIVAALPKGAVDATITLLEQVLYKSLIVFKTAKVMTATH